MGRRKGSWLENLIASRYKKAGYKVRKRIFTKAGEIDVLALRGLERLAIETKSGKQIITSSVIKNLYFKARQLRAKPKLKTGPRVKITKPTRKLAKTLGIPITKITFKKRKSRK